MITQTESELRFSQNCKRIRIPFHTKTMCYNGKKAIKGNKMAAKWRCTVCGYIYEPENGDPENNVSPGTPFEAIPDEWVCPICGASKDKFEPLEEE